MKDKDRKDKDHRNLFLSLGIIVLVYSLVVGAIGLSVPMGISAFFSMAFFFFRDA